MKYSVEKIKTRDGLVLDGLFFNLRNRNRAILFIHGFPGNFRSNQKIIEAFIGVGFAVLALNTRGHDILNITHKEKGGYRVLGSAMERFEDCVLDISAGVGFLKKKGFKEILLAGISSGADKVGYYLSQNGDRAIIAAIFISPGSNILIGRKELGKDFQGLLEESIEMTRKGFGLLPILGNRLEFPISYQRFSSLYSENSSENVFPFHNKKTDFKILAKIKIPILILMGDKDKYFFSKNIKTIANLLKRNIKNKPSRVEVVRGANHSFENKEKELAEKVKNWIE
ncbi:MAG: alpha/beta hydrolase [Candidatus Nealsonbacteria bacterium]|nr:alpha/beta hydrolase [Candidatus Nealsonbacteria bacterium]